MELVSFATIMESTSNVFCSWYRTAVRSSFRYIYRSILSLWHLNRYPISFSHIYSNTKNHSGLSVFTAKHILHELIHYLHTLASNCAEFSMFMLKKFHADSRYYIFASWSATCVFAATTSSRSIKLLSWQISWTVTLGFWNHSVDCVQHNQQNVPLSDKLWDKKPSFFVLSRVVLALLLCFSKLKEATPFKLESHGNGTRKIRTVFKICVWNPAAGLHTQDCEHDSCCWSASLKNYQNDAQSFHHYLNWWSASPLAELFFDEKCNEDRTFINFWHRHKMKIFVLWSF